MARVTVEDCVLKVPNRFNLVLYAAQRARDISSGATETLARDNDKNPVVALREIADSTIELSALQESLILGLQKHHPSDDYEEDPEAMESLNQEATVLGSAEETERTATGEAPEAEGATEEGATDSEGAEEAEEGAEAEPTEAEPTGEEPTGEEPTGEEPTGEEPTGEEEVAPAEEEE